jgi:hypothetical protein
MSRLADDAYAEARLHARYARLLPASEWQRLLHLDSFAGFLQQARETRLRPWLQHFDPAVDIHVLEGAVNQAFRQHVFETASWVPSPWRAAVRWLDRLLELPLIRHLASGGVAYPWVRSPTPPTTLGDGPTLIRDWQQQWLSLWPKSRSTAEAGALNRMLRDWQIAAAADAAGSGTASATLEAALRRRFRHHREAAVLAFSFLGLLWLEMARLRGALVRRRLLGVALPGAAS